MELKKIIKKYNYEIIQTILLIFSGTMLIISLLRINKEYEFNKKNQNIKLEEINNQLDRLELQLEELIKQNRELNP
ncbi:hypothetical protein ACR77J_14000 [Tissierella praeacuta]|uniref:hypothetical protein n=1 Tax=Tissierella praeacuta TaxID=43131 RepID=UPI0028AFBC9B|nr:hypothetical protein [Tissierella praeacuta]